MDVAGLTAAPFVFTIGGREFSARPLTDADVGEFERWMQQRALAPALQAIREIENADDRRAVLDAAIQRAENLNVTSRAGIAVMCTIEGQIELLFMALRKDAPDLSRTKLRELLLSDPAGMQSILESVRALEAIQDPKSAAAGPAPRAKPDKRKRSAQNSRR